jgi:signal peptidase I
VAGVVVAVGGAGTLVVAVLLRVFVFELFRIPSGAMIPTLPVGSHALVSKLDRTPRRGDVVVFRYPRDPSKDFVKRVIAVGGDTVEVRDGAPWLGGAPIPSVRREGPCSYVDVDEEGRRAERACVAFVETHEGRTYTVYRDPRFAPGSSFPPVTVPPGHAYVLGDNRDNSHDSRYWGVVPDELLKGKVVRVWGGAAAR